MMELRPLQAALLAGRSASRRATATPSPLSYPLAPSFYRCFSSTRPSRSEAEAAAPPPTTSMQEWDRQRQQQQQQQQSQQSEQPQPRTWGSPAGNNSPTTTFGMASLLKTTTAPSPTTPAPSEDRRRTPWATPSSALLRNNQLKRIPGESSKLPGILEDLALNLAPTSDDLANYPGQKEPANDIKYRLRPSIGRTVHLDSKVDLARGLGLLNIRVRTNKIAQDFAKQRFHERPGLKRKRLRSERWRARFKDGFKATCKRVQDLARQGW